MLQLNLLVRFTDAAVSGVKGVVLVRNDLIRLDEYTVEAQNSQLGFLAWVVSVLAQLHSVYGPDDSSSDGESARKHIAAEMDRVAGLISQIDGVCIARAYANIDQNVFAFDSVGSVVVNDRYGPVRLYGLKVNRKNILRAAFQRRVEFLGVDIAVVITVTCDDGDVDSVAALLSEPNIAVPNDRDLLYEGPFLDKVLPSSISELGGDFEVVVGADDRHFKLYFFEKMIRNQSGHAALVRAAHDGGLTVMAIVC